MQNQAEWAHDATWTTAHSACPICFLVFSVRPKIYYCFAALLTPMQEEVAYIVLIKETIADGDHAVYCFSYLSSVSVITFSCFWSCLKLPVIESISPAVFSNRSKRALNAALIVFILTSPSK